MILNCFQSFAADQFGNIQASASVEVRNAITGGIATIYKDARGKIPINPATFKTDQYGFFRFYAETGRYNIKVSSLGLDTSFLDVPVVAVSKQQIDVTEDGSGDFTTLQDAFNYISKAIPSHNSNERYQLNIYGNVGALTTSARQPVIINCVTDAQTGDLTLTGSTVHIIGSLQSGRIIAKNCLLTSETGSSIDCTSINNQGGRMEFVGTVATSESQTTNNGMHNIICSGGEVYFNATVSAKSQNKNYFANCSAGKIVFNGNIDIQASTRGAFYSDGGEIEHNGAFLSPFSVFYSGSYSSKGIIRLNLTSAVTISLVAGNTGLGGVSADLSGRTLVSGSAITCNGFTNAAYAATGGVIYASPSKILQGSSSALANITTNAYNTSGSAIFLGVA